MGRPRASAAASALLLVAALVLVPASPALAQAIVLDPPLGGHAGRGVGIQGTGFNDGQAVEIYLDGDLRTTVPGGQVSGGAFSWSFFVPSATPPGVATVLACQNCGDDVGVVFAEADWRVVTFDIAPTVGPVGTTMTASGTTWLANSPVTIFWDGEEVGTTTSNGAGEFSTQVEAPPSDTFGGLVTACQETCGIEAFRFFDIQETLTVDPPSSWAGSTVVVLGNGFTSDVEECDLARIYFDGTEVATTTPGTNGAFSVPITVPDVPVGTYPVRAEQSFCEIGASTTFQVIPRPPPTIAVSPDTGPPGGTTTATGEGWDDFLPLTLRFDGEDVLTIPAGGAAWTGATTFSAAMPVPDRLPGTYTVEACQQCGTGEERSARTTFTIPPPTIAVDPDEGIVADVTTVTGGNWNRGLDLTLTFDGEVVGTVAGGGPAWTGPGTFSTTITVPSRPPGPYPVRGCQNCGSPDERAATTTFTLVRAATLTLAPNGGPVQSTTLATGNGFDRTLEAQLTFDGIPVGTVPADGPQWTSATSFTIELTVPDRPARPYTVRACQRCGTPDEVAATAIFVVVPTLAIDPAEGPVGTEAVVSGTGWHHDESLTLLLAGGTVATVPVGSDGFVDLTNLRLDLTIPDLPRGPHIVRACQRCGELDEVTTATTFTVVPHLLTNPGLGSPRFVTSAVGSGFPADTTVTLRWDRGTFTTVAQTDSLGRFRVPMLVIGRDRLGPRNALAFVDPEAPQPDATAPYLVTPGTVQPPDFVSRR